MAHNMLMDGSSLSSCVALEALGGGSMKEVISSVTLKVIPCPQSQLTHPFLTVCYEVSNLLFCLL